MIFVILFSLLAGALLGARFSIASLIPAMFVGVVAILSIGVVGGLSFWSIVVLECLALTGLQIGYLMMGALVSVPAPWSVARRTNAVDSKRV